MAHTCELVGVCRARSGARLGRDASSLTKQLPDVGDTFCARSQALLNGGQDLQYDHLVADGTADLPDCGYWNLNALMAQSELIVNSDVTHCYFETISCFAF